MKLYILFFAIFFSSMVQSQIYTTISGEVDFVSNAPLEIIKASSDKMQGVLDLERKSFAFKIYIKSFEGFNNSLQKIHFYENYMETDEFPEATFRGKILEPLDYGRKHYRAKGILSIHGKSVERIVEVNITLKERSIIYAAEFFVPLEDHDIRLPRIVYQKIAENIKVNIQGEMKRKE